MKAFYPFVLISSIFAANAVTQELDYDYVIIGSGPGGGTLGASLARAGYSVFLIEAGENRGDELLQQVPNWAARNVETPGMGWGFFASHYLNETQDQRDRYYTYRLSNGSFYTGLDPPQDAKPLGIFYPRGSTVGGSTISNAMNFMLPPDSFWDYIADITDEETWSAQNMRDYFIEIENNTYAPPDTPGHGYDGYISSNHNNISFVTTRPGVMRVVRNAIEELEGITNATEAQVIELMERDMNGLDADRFSVEGVYQTVVNIDPNRRRSSPWNYITETLEATNENGDSLYPLKLSTSSLATRVLFAKCSGKPKAVGVEYLVGQGLYEADQRYDPSDEAELRTVHARKEVIIAGGSFNTPQILKLSGIGPRSELEKHGIPVLVDLPAVGEYLRDNYEAGVNVQASIPWENSPFAHCNYSVNGTAETDPCLAEWLIGYGAYGEGSAPIFMLMQTALANSEYTDLIIFGGARTVFDGHFPGFSRATSPPESFFFAVVKVQSEEQNGFVRLRSSNPRETPQIHLDFYPGDAGNRDIEALAEGVRRCLDILKSTGTPYEPLNIVDPRPGITIEQGIRDHTWSHHVTSSCRMGPENSKDYCVNSKFKVNGVDGLRVVDSSIFPISPGGFPASATLTASRKAFYDILDDIRKS